MDEKFDREINVEIIQPEQSHCRQPFQICIYTIAQNIINSSGLSTSTCVHTTNTKEIIMNIMDIWGVHKYVLV